MFLPMLNTLSKGPNSAALSSLAKYPPHDKKGTQCRLKNKYTTIITT